jgi:hypothetical protein
MIQNFTWNNGTLESPIVLTTQQISTLISAGNNPDINTSVKGVIKSSTGIYKYLKYALTKLYGSDLTVLGEEVADSFQISAPTSNLLEGNSMTLNVSSSSGMTAEDLQYKLIFGTVKTDNVLDEDTIKSRISINNGILQISQAQENGSWEIPVTVKACPLYEDIDTTNNFVKSEAILCRAVAMTSFSAQAEESISINSSADISYITAPSNTTKLGTAKIVYEITEGDGSFLDGRFYASEKPGNVTIKVTCTLAGGASFTSTVNIKVKNSTQSTITIWNGGVDGGISDTKSMVTGDVVVDPTTAAIHTNSDNVILWIRKNSHLYLCKYMGRDIGMKIKQLDDNDRRKYSDGTDASKAIAGAPGSDGIIMDVMLKLPTFYYKCVTNVDNPSAVDVIFSAGNDDANSYYEWDTNKRIGVYEGVIYRDGVPLNPTSSTSYASGDVMYSISGVTPTANYSQASFKQAARARNTVPVGTVATDGFQIVDYETHVIMALLYYGYYGGYNINCQEVIGYGTSSYPKVAGYYTDELGMNDTFSKNMGGTGDSGSINFWGLENWWGDLYEWVDNLITATSTGIVRINNWQGNPVRYLQVPTDYLSKDQCISKMIFNEASLKVDSSGNPTGEYTNYPDLLFKELSGSTDFTKYYADAGCVNAYSGYVACRSSYGSDANGGVGRLYLNYASSATYGHVGSRLVFCGTVTDVTGTAEADSF